jgi:YVTN family beta-propeller protein
MATHILALAIALLAATATAQAGQAPAAAAARDEPVGSRDRVYLGEQYSNTISVVDPASNTLVGAIHLGDPQPGNLSPLYRGQLLVHGLGFSPDHRTLVAVSIGSNSVSFIDTATNAVKHITYVGRAPHEAFFTPDGREVWVSVRGEDYVSILDAKRYGEIARVPVPNGPGMVIFSPDGRYGYVCSSFTPETVIFEVRTRRVAGRVPQPSPFCPNIAAAPRGDQVWFTLKDVGKVVVFNAHAPFSVLREIDTGPLTNHVNFALTDQGQLAYVTIGGLNQVHVFRTDTLSACDHPYRPFPRDLALRRRDAGVCRHRERRCSHEIDTKLQQVAQRSPPARPRRRWSMSPMRCHKATDAPIFSRSAATMTTHLRLSAPGATGDATTVALFDPGLTRSASRRDGLAQGRLRIALADNHR